jgi:poly(3-hydroxybutyrate) depolymerase
MSKLTGCCRRWRNGIFYAVAILGMARAVPADEIKTGFQECVYRDATGDHKYTLFVPAAYTPEKKWPLLVFLHGAGARGTDNKLPRLGGLAPIVRDQAATFPFLVVFPQCEDTESRLLLGWNSDTADGQRVFKILDQVEREFSVDRSHEILTGGSMGGCGTWSLLAAHPERWSAGVVIAGDCNPAFAPQLAKVPVWVFHGIDDVAIPIENVRRLCNSVREAGGRATLTELKGMRHNIGYVVYGDPALYEWVLQPQTDPKQQGILSQAGRRQTDVDMGREAVQPFVPAVEVPEALLVRVDRATLESLMATAPDLIPPGTVAGNGDNVHQSKRAFLTRFDISLSDIHYSGNVEQLNLTPENDGWMTMDVGLRNVTLEVGSTQVKGGMVSATSGPMDIVVGHAAPVWLRIRVRPQIVDRRIRFELGGAQFQIPDDNWYVTTPQVEVRGLFFTRNRVSSMISKDMVTNAYGRKAEIEAQVAAAAPALVHKLEEHLDERFSKAHTVGSVPMPAYQPRYLVWPNKLRVDESGIAVVLGMTFARPGLFPAPPSPRQITGPKIDLAKLSAPRGLEFGFSRAATEGLTAAIFDTGAATLDVLDVPAKKFAVLSQVANVVEAVPDLARFGDKLQVRSQLHFCEPVSLHAAHASSLGPNRLVFAINKIELRLDYKLATDAPWRHCAVFDARLVQEFQFDLDRLEFGSRFIHVANPAETEIEIVGRFAPDYHPIDRTLDEAKILELGREAWGSCRSATGGKGIPITDRKIGAATFRMEEVRSIDPFIVFRRVPAATSITNRSQKPLTYSVRIARSEWSPPYTLAPGKAHVFHTTSPLMFRTLSSTDAPIQTLPMGTSFAYRSSDQTPGTEVAHSSATDSVK